MNRFFYTLLFFCVSVQILFAQPQLFFDDFRGLPSSNFLPQIEFNGQYVFNLRDVNKRDIWITDGTNTNNLTIWLSDKNFTNPTVTDNYLYFIEDSNVPSIWKNDGTYTSSEKVWEHSGVGVLHGFQDKLFAFTYTRQDSIASVWVIDENDNATKLLDSTYANQETVIFDNYLYFFTLNHGLIKSDGTVSGTSIVKSLDLNFSNATFSSTVVFNDELYFIVKNNIGATEVWKTDGTTAGTVSLGNIQMSEFNSKINFLATSNHIYIYGNERIYTLNNQGFNLILNQDSSDFLVSIYEGRVINNKAIFAINTFGKNGTELWESDGTATGTKLLIDLNQYAADGITNTLNCFEVIGDYLYFIGNDGRHGKEIWRTDGTADGTQIVTDFTPNAASSDFQSMFSIGERLYLFRRKSTLNAGSTLNIWKFDLNNFTPEASPTLHPNSQLYSFYAGYSNRFNDFEQDKNKASYLAFTNQTHSGDRIIYYQQDTSFRTEEALNHHSIITKLSPAHEFEWATIISTDVELFGKNIAVMPDSKSNVFVAGEYMSYLKINDQDINVQSEGFHITKLDINGALDWVYTGKATGDFYIHEVLVNQKDDVIIIGTFDFINFKGNTYSGNHNTFILKLDKTGKLLSFLKIGEFVNDIVATLTTNDALLIASSDGSTLHLHKINQNNEIVWYKSFKDNTSLILKQLAINSIDEIFLVGSYSGDFKLNTNEAAYHKDNNEQNAFLAKFNTFGEPVFLKADGQTRSINHSIAFDSENNYFLLSKIIHDTRKFYVNWEAFNTTNESIIQKFDINGQLIKEKSLLHIGSTFYGNTKLHLGTENNVLYMDNYYEQLDSFANCISRSSLINNIIFLLDVPINNTLNSFEPTYVETDITISPNPATTTTLVHIHDENWQTYQLNIYNSTGQLVKSINKTDDSNAQSVRIADLPTGLLIFEFKNGDKKLTKKVIKY